MAAKRKTLPKDFEALLKLGDLNLLKQVFDKCEINARGGYGKQTALAFDECPHELAKWLLEKGADLHATDTWGNTALHARARSLRGNIKSLLELGADVNIASSSFGTPLHAAADSHNPENVKMLLEHGAKTDIVNSYKNSPLEQALMSCNNIDIEDTLEISKMIIGAGVVVTDKMKKYVKRIGEDFEFHRAGFNKDSVQQVSDALDELYKVFGAEPVARRKMHDGKSQITVKEKTWQKQHQELWELLIPSSGAAETIQGEVIRISGRISGEIHRNGGANWDSDYKKMADTFLQFMNEGISLLPDEISETAELVKALKGLNGDTDRLCELGVKWVLANPTPMKLPPVDYKR